MYERLVFLPGACKKSVLDKILQLVAGLETRPVTSQESTDEINSLDDDTETSVPHQSLEKIKVDNFRSL